MAGLQSTLISGTLHSILKCIGMHTGLAEYTSDSTQETPARLLKSLKTWLKAKASSRADECYISLRGTRQFWFKQRSRLISLIDALGMPTIFFTHSATNNQWPELVHLIADNPESCSSRSSAVNDNPAIADWFFFECISKFMKVFYEDVLGATDYWFQFKWQHRGSPHVYGVAWLEGAPDVEMLLATDDLLKLLDATDKITAYVDRLVSTTNPGILADRNNMQKVVPLPVTNPHDMCATSNMERSKT